MEYVSLLSWLSYDWDQNGNYNDVRLPDANFSFGSYRGNDRIIYWREKFQWDWQVQIPTDFLGQNIASEISTQITFKIKKDTPKCSRR